MSREMRKRSALYHSVLADEEFDDIVATPAEDDEPIQEPAPIDEIDDAELGDDDAQIMDEIEDAEQALEEAPAAPVAPEDEEIGQVMDDIDELSEQIEAPESGDAELLEEGDEIDAIPEEADDNVEVAYAEAREEARRRVRARMRAMRARHFNRRATRTPESIGDQKGGGDPSTSTLFKKRPLPTMGEAVKKLTAHLDFLANECQRNGNRKAAYLIDQISNEIEKG